MEPTLRHGSACSRTK